MNEISRAWWAGYVASFCAGLAAITLAWWILLPEDGTPAPVPPPPPQPVAADLPALSVESLLARLRQSRDGIRSYRMLCSWEERELDPETPLEDPDPGGEVTSAASGVWMEKGDWYRVEKHFDIALEIGPAGPVSSSSFKEPEDNATGTLTTPVTMEMPDGRTVTMERRIVSKDDWHVFNGKERVWWSSRYNSIYLDPVKFLPNPNDLRYGDAYPEPLRWGFDLRQNTFEEIIGANHDHAWTVHAVDADDGPRYLLLGKPTPDGVNEHTRMEFAFDPLRDYLIRNVRTWHRDKLTEQVVIALQQSGDGRWYPETGVMRNESRICSVQFSDAEFNIPLDDTLFHWENMPFDAHSVKLHKQTSEKSSTTMRFRNGYWVSSL